MSIVVCFSLLFLLSGDEAAIDAEMDQIKAHFESIGKRELFMDYITGRDNYTMAKDAAEKHKLDPVESYRRTAGEVEARNVQERMDMTMEERLNSLLSETEDVAEKDKIYLNGLVRGGSEMAAALRKKGDPNTADQKNQLRSGDVPHIIGFKEWAGLKGKKLYADYEFLYSRHHKYFSSPEETKAAVELVLAKPEQVEDKGKNLSFVGFDEETGDIFRIEINPKIKGQANHIRSIFKITADNYNKIKLDPPRVLQPSSTELQKTGRKTMTITSFMNNLPSFFQNASEETGKTSEKINGEGRIGTDRYGDDNSRFSISPEADVTETALFKDWFGDSKVVDENGKPLEVYHGTNWDGWEFDTENGAFFSEKEDYAEEMAAQRGGSRIVKAYLSIRNPLEVKVPGNKMADPEFEARIIAEAKSKGHDGVKLETDTNNEIEKDVFWVAFEPNQIKSATDNVGTFDPGNPDVRFSVAPDDAFVQAWAKVLLPVVSTQYINVAVLHFQSLFSKKRIFYELLFLPRCY